MPNLQLYSVRDGEVQSKAGLNWGFSKGHTNVDDAYIALRKEFFENNQDFFPGQGEVISVIWDDGTQMRLLLEGTQNIDGDIYPKQISSDCDKSILGNYLRARLNVDSSKVITMDDLEEYGRNDITVTQGDNGEYIFDFSVSE